MGYLPLGSALLLVPQAYRPRVELQPHCLLLAVQSSWFSWLLLQYLSMPPSQHPWFVTLPHFWM